MEDFGGSADNLSLVNRGRKRFAHRVESPLSSPHLTRRNPGVNSSSGNNLSMSSLASSRDSSLDRSGGGGGFHALVERVVSSSPKLGLRRRLQVMRSGSFNDVDAATRRRKRWLVGRSESLRTNDSSTEDVVAKNNNNNNHVVKSPPWWSLDISDGPRRGSLPVSTGLSRSMDRVQRMERRGTLQHSHSVDYCDENNAHQPGKVKGFVNR